jgi:hypothetical protein
MRIWIAIGLVALILAGISLMQLIGGINPMLTNKPGWECDATRGAAKICVKDAKPLK